MEARARILQQYASLRDAEDFDPEQFLDEQRQAVLAGVTDDLSAATLGQSLAQVEAEVRGDFMQVRQRRLREAAEGTVYSMLQDTIRADVRPEESADVYFRVLLPEARALGFSPAQAAGALLARVQEASSAAGGVPEMFDIFDQRDGEGMTILARNPDMVSAIRTARQQATQQREQFVRQATEKDRALLMMTLRRDIRNGTLTGKEPEFFTQYVGKFGLTDNEVTGMYLEMLENDRKAGVVNSAPALAAQGNLLRLSGAEQRKHLETALGPMMDELLQLADSGDAPRAADAGAMLLRAYSSMGSSEKYEPLVNLFTSVVTTAPSPQGPSARFQALAALYASQSVDPVFRDVHVPEQAGRILSAYVRNLNSLGPLGAYEAAYRPEEPGALDAAKKAAQDPKVQKAISSAASEAVAGSGWAIGRLFGGNGRPTNDAEVAGWLTERVRQHALDNGISDPGELKEVADRIAARSFVMDGTSRRAVRVPEGFASEATSKAVTAYTARVLERALATGAAVEGAQVQLHAVGTEGQLAVRLVMDGRSMPAGVTSVREITEWHRKSTSIDIRTEGPQLAAYLRALRSGQPLPQMDPELLARAEQTGYLQPEDARSLREAQSRVLMERFSRIPRVDIDAPADAPVAYTGPARADHRGSARAAQQLLSMGTPDIGMAASLIALREGLVTAVYNDPAKGAGQNIGFGYNLDANKDRLESDFKRAGIDPSLIPAIKEGRAQITPEQAQKLLMVTLPPYVKRAEMAVNRLGRDGLWQDLSPQQRAIMVDIAYQVGSVDKFEKAIKALADNDAKAFSAEVSTFYTDRSGNRREDTRARRLRADLLAGRSQWHARIQQVGRLPSSALESALPTTQ